MRKLLRGIKVLAFSATFANLNWAHGPGHMPEPNAPSREGYDPANSKKNRLDQVQWSITRINKKLENPNLSPEKRTKLEKKREKLHSLKNRLLEEYSL